MVGQWQKSNEECEQATLWHTCRAKNALRHLVAFTQSHMIDPRNIVMVASSASLSVYDP